MLDENMRSWLSLFYDLFFFSHFKWGIAICQTIPATYQNTEGTDSVRDPNNATEGICKYFFLFQTAWSMFIF